MTQSYPSVFEQVFEVLLEFEGYMSDDKHDAGGLTKYGISQRAYPSLDIANLTIDDAKRIYYTDYFLKAKCDQLPTELACHVFDTAVNMGVSRAIRFMQRAIKTTADGIFGKGSRAALQQALSNRGETNIALDYLSYRSVFYSRIVQRNQTQQKYLRGWLRRTYRLQQFILSDRQK
ncbi:glycoside hydrolase family 108 protein [Pseudoalteromonas umbrosa]|uniref:glycoside hydrolase family 108 protein n=1 Tax=Pseudoalteromonas umbrosa TaxID=3048489 RepID=UPI0024C43502|nr:glycosyl hydrolase 108 family protein [Pseudoalteromonas sp. B95]MDK1290097.1 glycosyl hydrolase 108 family protein [Pseudoalteromonas sp. B95]